ncbi:sensor histidine kinase [Nocardiopsis ganjiahuensis]|uniref:sensor histidine kinase n=1 Tax=Nocardiopsis ganjiahuensis TaxID=239984 RepID=UPI000344EFC6|nr:sensor histidine kinase [Nocardiopsis ganjiahuensis]
METVPEHDLDLRQRRLITAVPYVLLAASTVLTVVTHESPWPRNLETLGLVALAAALIWAMTGLNPEWSAHPKRTAALVAALVVMIAVLSTRSVWFAGFFGFTGYVYSWHFLRGRWKFAGVAATAAVTVTAYLGGLPDPTPASVLFHVFFVAAVVYMVAIFSHFGEVTAERSDERGRMVEQLRETIRENEGLQAQLLLQAREAGTHDERERMAREIHDTLAQGFVGIIAQLQAAERAEADTFADPDDPNRAEWRLRIANATRLARENLVEARRSVHALGPAPLEGAPLTDALAGLTAEWSRLNGVRADFTTTGPVVPLHPEVESALLRTAQEALSNVAGHAGATRVGVTLSYVGDLVVLDVRDDGAGFAPGSEASGGFGLTSMRQRVTRLAGTLEIESEPGAGAAVSATVPAVPREPSGE